MGIRKPETWQELVDADRLIATAFLDPWDEEAARERRKAEAEGKVARTDDVWGDFDERGCMRTAVVTRRMDVAFDGAFVPAGEFDMVGSLPEYRGAGNVRAMFGQVLRDFRARGDVFALLIPFSFAFYRKFGFEVCARNLEQRIPIGQLSPFRCECAVRQVSSAEDVPALRSLYEAFALGRNLMPRRGDADWAWHGSGEFGERGWFTRDKRRYTYLFGEGEPGSGEVSTPHGYLKFFFETGAAGPFIGTMRVEDMVYDSPATLRSILGFIYGMRAKLVDVVVECELVVDLALLVPEVEKVQSKVGGHFMARTMDVARVLQAMGYPREAGRFSVWVGDDFLPENTGRYDVTFADGRATAVDFSTGVSSDAADLVVDVRTFTQLAVGLIDLRAAELRESTAVNANRGTLERIFVRKPVCIG
jgi:predicted acetyltransferase